MQVTKTLVLMIESAYVIPNINIKGIACKTNIPPNAAFRGYGIPQATFFMEQVVTRVAHHLGLDRDSVCELNMFKEGDTTCYGKILSNCNLRPCWMELHNSDVYKKRKAAVQDFNKLVCTV